MRSSASIFDLPPLIGMTAGSGGRCAEVRDVLAIAGDERCPLESFARSHDDRFRAVDGNLHDMAAIDVVSVSAAVSGEDHVTAVIADGDVLRYVVAGREQQRFAAVF